MAKWAFVALGSNLGDRNLYLKQGVQFLTALCRTRLVAKSQIEETEALGPIPQDRYLNQMVLLRTKLSPRELLEACQKAERKAGRQREGRWGPRTLDMDIVRHGNKCRREPDLIIPHPEIRNRGFWIRELAELMPLAFTKSDPVLPKWAQTTPGRRAHIRRVVGLLAAWAVAMAVSVQERRRWLRAGFLHDALKDASSAMLREWSRERWGIPSLYHGPAAAQYAKKQGETDAGVLDAATYHSVGYTDWDVAGKMLYMADYLEPARSPNRKTRADWAAQVPNDPDGILRLVARERRAMSLRSGGKPPRESTIFWDALGLSS